MLAHYYEPLCNIQVAAHQSGMNVLVLSLVTNAVVIPEKYHSPREEVEREVTILPLSSFLP
jgi:purine-nucleoside phosphorylase